MRSAPSEHFKRVKLFDFDERPENYYDVPMHWARLTGDGLPAYSEGVFDDDVGHDAPPSFRITTAMENVAFEYSYPDLDVIPGADYLVIGYVRTAGVRHSRAFIEAHFVDRFGERISDSVRISDLTQSADEPGGEWRRVEIALEGTYPRAASLRLRVMLLQRYVWHDAPADAIDPIVNQDIQPTAWFDDIAVYRLPRAEMWVSELGGVVTQGRDAALIVKVHNAADAELSADLNVRDRNGERVLVDELTVAPHLTEPFEVTLPELPVGGYSADLQLRSGTQPLLSRRLRFAVVQDFDRESRPHDDFGVTLGPRRVYDVDSLATLLRQLETGLVQVSVPMVGPLDSEDRRDYFAELDAVMRDLRASRVTLGGVMMSPLALYDRHLATPTRQMVAGSNLRWRELVNPVLAQLAGGPLSAWQLGAADIEAAAAPWTPALVADVEAQLGRFTSLPRVVVPQSLLDGGTSDTRERCYWADGSIPTRVLPRYLDFLVARAAAPRWVFVDPAETAGLSHREQLADFARRVVITKALDPDHLLVAAPIELSRASGAARWQPTDKYIVLRSLLHHLGGLHGVGAVALDYDGVALVFAGARESVMVVWTWRSTPQEVPVDLYLGTNPEMVDLWGERSSVPTRDGRAYFHLTPEPRFLVNVEAPLALLQASFDVSPRYLQIHTLEPRPVIHFRNHYDQPLTGTALITPPEDWYVEPQLVEFTLPPGEALDQELQMTVPHRQVATSRDVAVRITTESPKPAELDFVIPFEVGLKNVLADASAWWRMGRCSSSSASATCPNSPSRSPPSARPPCGRAATGPSSMSPPARRVRNVIASMTSTSPSWSA